MLKIKKLKIATKIIEIIEITKTVQIPKGQSGWIFVKKILKKVQLTVVAQNEVFMGFKTQTTIIFFY